MALHHRLDGPPDAPVIVLTGSLGTELSMWEPQARPLSERHRVLRYDIRGHGSSDVPPGPYTMADLGGDLLGLMDELGIEHASLCGLSIGGMISMWVAAHAPERVDRSILCCTTAYFGPEAGFAQRAATVREGGVEPIADSVLERWFTPAFSRENPDVVGRFRAMLSATPREGYAGCCEAIEAMDLRGDLGAIRAPALVISGAEDPVTPPSHGQALAEGIAGARFTAVPDAAHLANVAQAQRVTELILGFLEEAST